MEIEYTIMLEINGTSEELGFEFDLKEIEEDGIHTIMDNAIENHIQDHYCSCSFSEAQNHCDCDHDYNGYKITERKAKDSSSTKPTVKCIEINPYSYDYKIDIFMTNGNKTTLYDVQLKRGQHPSINAYDGFSIEECLSSLKTIAKWS